MEVECVPAPKRSVSAESQLSDAYSESQHSDAYSDSQDDDDDEYSFHATEDKPTAAATEPAFCVLSGLDVAKEQEHSIEKIASLFELTKLEASILCRKFAWRTERLMEHWWEDEEAVREKAGLSTPTAKRQRSGECSSPGGASADLMCSVCFCEMSPKECSSLACSHLFCNDCWTSHLKVQIADGNANQVTCMADACTVLVEPPLAQALLDAEHFAKFARFSQKQFVDDNPYLKWCPGAGCEKVIKVHELGSCPETLCSCGMLFCFSCSSESHFPLSCQALQRWEDKKSSDSSTGQWFQAHAKRCRKCHAFIEKNGGCNWIHCRCGHQFCFFCFSTDPAHHNVPCNAPPPPEANSAKSDLEYFMHYFDRYDGHAKSQKIEEQMRAQVAVKMDELMRDDSKTRLRVEVEYLNEAVEMLIACRRLLKHTYPFAFYMPRSNQKLIFEDLQARLESRTEALSGLLEAEGEPEKLQVLNMTSDAKKQMANMRELLESRGEPETWVDK